MQDVSADLVDIVREFLAARRIMRRLADRHRQGDLKFSELEEFVSDDEDSVLYRLKERSHALFRPRDPALVASMRREALFDLAVGSLFHEAMKLRENFYQHEIYGPRVRALRSASGDESDPLLEEFEKILQTVSQSLAEGLRETETLIDQTGRQLRVLLVEHPENAFVLRYLIENRQLVEEVLEMSLDDLLAEIEGDAAAGYEVAARSYLDSGFYRDAERAFASAVERGGKGQTLERMSEYARGMAAYLTGDYGECIARLSTWFEGGEGGEGSLLKIARASVSKIDQLAQGATRDRIVAAAADLMKRLGPEAPPENLGSGV